MFVIKKCKTIALAALMMFIAISTVYSENYTVPAELESYGSKIYRKARSYFGNRSFNGYCGTYVKCQLRAMGIFDDKFDFHGNGNQWYSNFENTAVTSGGYYVYRESGSDCMKKLADNYGDNLSNIVLTFPIQSGYSARYPGAGHALVIYKVVNGIAYYSESFRFGGYAEGQVIAEDVESLVERYQRRHGSPIGCVLLSEEKLSQGGSLIAGISYNEDLHPQLKARLDEISNVMFIAEKFAGNSQTREA